MSDQSKIDEVIKQKRPKLIFLTGRTSTGKTTLSKSLQKKHEYAVIELDDVINGLDAPEHVVKYVEVYLNREVQDLVHAFVSAVKQQITESLTNHPAVIIEGALTNIDTLKEIITPWSDSFLLVYLHPKNIDAYKERLLSRFALSNKDNDNRLPAHFWEKLSSEQVEKYYQDRVVTPEIEKAIAQCAKESAEVSDARLAKFSATFKDVLKIEV